MTYMRIIPSIMQMLRLDLQQPTHLRQPPFVHRLALKPCEELLRVDDECAFGGHVCREDICEVFEWQVTEVFLKVSALVAEVSEKSRDAIE